MKRAVMLSLLALAGCKKHVDTEGYEKRLEKELGDLGIEAEKVECPKNASAEKGKSFTCQITIGGKTYGFEATVKDKHGDTIDMDTRWVDGKGLVSHKIETALAKDLTTAWGFDTKVDCGDRLRFLEADSTLTCKATVEGLTVDIKMTFDDQLVGTSWHASPEPVAKAKLEGMMNTEVGKQIPGAAATCGDKNLFVVPDDGVFYCTVTDGKQQGKLRVQFAPGTTNVTDWKVEQ